MRPWVGLIIVFQLVLAVVGAPVAAAPLTFADVETLLTSKVSSKRTAKLVRERKAAFELTKKAARRLQGLGAREDLLTAIRNNPAIVVFVESEPSAAEVFIDGKYRGITPVRLQQVEPGRHKLQVGRVGGYQEHVEDLLLQGGEPVKKRIVLKRHHPPAVAGRQPEPETAAKKDEGVLESELLAPTTGEAATESQPAAPPAGSEAATQNELATATEGNEAAAGTALSVPTAGNEATAAGSPGGRSGNGSPSAETEGPLVPVRVQTDPINAEIYLDGKYMAASPAEFLATAGHHNLRVVLKLGATHETIEKEILVESDKLNVFSLRLKEVTPDPQMKEAR